MAIDVQKVDKLEEMKISKQGTELKVLAASCVSSSGQKKQPHERRIGASRVICNLPTIEED